MSSDATDKADLQHKLDNNIWDHVDDVLAILTLARTGKWMWYANPKCKYIGLRIDMRDGGCILTDRDGKRISLQELAAQVHSSGNGPGWPSRSTSIEQQSQSIADEQQRKLDEPIGGYRWPDSTT